MAAECRVAAFAAAALAAALLGAAAPAGAVPSSPRAELRERAEAASRALEARPGLRFLALEARALLDRADHEDARNDASGFSARAEGEARHALDHIAAAGSADPAAADLLAWQRELLRAFGEAAPRADLERRLDAFLAPGQAAALGCTAAPLAQAYSYLVQARNAYGELGWRYADPYFRLAEARLAEADSQGARCAGTAR